MKDWSNGLNSNTPTLQYSDQFPYLGLGEILRGHKHEKRIPNF